MTKQEVTALAIVIIWLSQILMALPQLFTLQIAPLLTDVPFKPLQTLGLLALTLLGFAITTLIAFKANKVSEWLWSRIK